MTRLSCRCGAVCLDIEKAPILTVACCCQSCRTAAERLQALPGAARVTADDGSTPFVLYRKDRVRLVSGLEHLRDVRLTPDATTRRVVADCCHTLVFLEFKGGHWLSLYAALWPEPQRPPMDERTMTSDLPPGTELPGDVPNSRHQSLSFMMKLMKAWIAMGFRSPQVTTNGDLHA